MGSDSNKDQDSEARPGQKVLVITAIIGLIGTLGVATIGLVGTLGGSLIAKWPFFQPSEQSSNVNVPQPDKRTLVPKPSIKQIPEQRSVVDVTGTWVDSGNPQNRSTITQTGSSFQFSKHGVLADGTEFDSEGRGEIAGHDFECDYTASYLSSPFPKGHCSGKISFDGTSVSQTCNDPRFGKMIVVSYRE